MLRVVHITEDFTPANTGVTTSLQEVATHVRAADLEMRVVAPGDQAVPTPPDVPVRLCAVPRWGRPWRYSPQFTAALREALAPPTVFFLYGVWMAPQALAARFGARHGVPVIFSARNMLNHFYWHQTWGRWVKKTLYWHLVAHPCFRHLAAIHAQTPDEVETAHRLFPGKRVELIPKGIDLKNLPPGPATAAPAEPYLMFLGRLHPVKGLESLLAAFHRLPAPRLKLKIVGPAADEGYLAHLKALAASGPAAADIEFCGPAWDDEKRRLLRGARAVCVPSHTESGSYVVIEGMACGTPVITTPGSGWPDVPEGGGLLVESDADALYGALTQALAWSDAERADRGRAARALVEQHYSWDVIAPRFISFYRSVL